MHIVNRHTFLWSYLSDYQKGLIVDGEMLLDHLHLFKHDISDYSFLVFPFSKAYEGFLKKFFLDIGLIKQDAYYSDDIRIGRLLNPGTTKRSGGDLYLLLCKHERGGKELSDILWDAWKKGRNEVFHYFPHNFKKLNYDEAISLITQIAAAMEIAVTQCDLHESNIITL
ncbi:MAG: hypothetical protein RLY61_773 [Candidatus Parcubacteria bacterium]|jgi:hypothetical protein